MLSASEMCKIESFCSRDDHTEVFPFLERRQNATTLTQLFAVSQSRPNVSIFDCIQLLYNTGAMHLLSPPHTCCWRERRAVLQMQATHSWAKKFSVLPYAWECVIHCMCGCWLFMLFWLSHPIWQFLIKHIYLAPSHHAVVRHKYIPFDTGNGAEWRWAWGSVGPSVCIYTSRHIHMCRRCRDIDRHITNMDLGTLVQPLSLSLPVCASPATSLKRWIS